MYMLKSVIFVTFMVISLSILLPFPPTMGQTTTLSVEPYGTFGLVPGSSFSVDIAVSDVTDLKAWQFYLYYNSSVLNGTSVTEGPFLKAGGVSTFYLVSEFADNYNASEPGSGRMIVACTRVGNVTGVDGNGTLATITFRVVDYGFSILHFDNTKLLDSVSPFGNLIPHTLIDGQAYAGLINVAINEIETPTSIPGGSMVNINVTAQNRGQLAETFDVTLYYDVTPIGTQTIVNLLGGGTQILSFAWDVTPLPIGEYNLTATATTVPGETDTSDNTLSVMVHIGVADLAIASVTPLKTVVGQEFSTPINVTVTNQGEFSATSNITAYANQTVIATFQNITLTSGNTTTLTFTWNATVAMGNYTISAYVQPVPFETNTSNNNLTSPVMVRVGMPSDVVAPFGVIDMKDIAYVAKRFGTTPSAPLWDPNADFDSSGKIDMKDIALVAKNFGAHAP
jgi:hypothetical protein